MKIFDWLFGKKETKIQKNIKEARILLGEQKEEDAIKLILENLVLYYNYPNCWKHYLEIAQFLTNAGYTKDVNNLLNRLSQNPNRKIVESVLLFQVYFLTLWPE